MRVILNRGSNAADFLVFAIYHFHFEHKRLSGRNPSIMFAKRGLFAKVAALVTVIYPQVVVAEGFTSADVLGWEQASQHTLFQDSITMIGIVATQIKPEIAACINEWYSQGDDVVDAQYDSVRAALSRFPDNHPQAVILAMVQKHCGKFSD